jgi:L-alanine-DL-glutamate epimerase-like enolase superfamily enzyme
VEPDTGNELFWRLYTDVPQARDGYLDLDTQPGLGVELDRDAVHRLAYSAPPSVTAG